jgi:hypothetical protein
MSPVMPGKYRQLTPELRADHMATLAVLGHRVVAASAPPLHWRKFVVVTVGATPRVTSCVVV